MPYSGADPAIKARVAEITERLRTLFSDMSATQAAHARLRREVIDMAELPMTTDGGFVVNQFVQRRLELLRCRQLLLLQRHAWKAARANTPADIGRYITLADLIPASDTACLFGNTITLTFVLEESVTPDFFARRVAEACANAYTIREREGVQLPSNPSTILTFTEVRTPITFERSDSPTGR